MGGEFFNNRRVDPRDRTIPEPPIASRQDDLDRLELSLDYTPGGQLEQDVHTQLSDDARREYKQRTQSPEPSREQDYLSQVQERFDKQVEEDRREQQETQSREEADAKRAEQKEAREKSEQQEKEAAERKERSAPSYDMPEQGEDASAPASPPPPSVIRPRPGRLGPGERDRSDGGHEH